MGERELLIALNRVPGVGAAKVAALRRAFGSLEALPSLSAETIARTCKEIGPKISAQIVETLASGFAERELALAEEKHVHLLTPGDRAWPRALDDLDSPPLCLYCAGDLSLLSQPQIALVGTRQATLYGREQAEAFAFRLASAGLHITSGLAAGIDAAAHTGALCACENAASPGAGKTLAVIGAALDRIYPSPNIPLARRIVQAGGLVLCEYAFGRAADRFTFPQRNRLVAALAKATVVVETATRGGTLITAACAQKIGRPVYALPGRLDWPSFGGNHALLAEGSATFLASPETLIDRFSSLELPFPDAPQTAALPPGLSPDEQRLFEALGSEELSLDDLCARTGLPMPTVMSLTIGLQMRKRLRPLPGGLVRRA